jgi:hypothetical protein
VVQLLDTIVETYRASSSWFFVVFSGSGFDLYSRNRVFVYRKRPMGLFAFTDEIGAQFSQVRIASEPLSDHVIDDDQMFIQILLLEPALPERVDNPLPSRFCSPPQSARVQVRACRHSRERHRTIPQPNLRFATESFPSASYCIEVAEEIIGRRVNFDFTLNVHDFRHFLHLHFDRPAERMVKFLNALSNAIQVAQATDIRQ